MTDWEYGGAYRKYNMEGVITLPTGELKVHNIFDPLPEFMLQADCIFSDPPCSKQNINSFYTKADRCDYQESFEPFTVRFFECIDQIKPKNIFIEVFKSNKNRFISECEARYDHVEVYDSTYYHKSQNNCWIIHASDEVTSLPLNGMDEEEVIAWICGNFDYECIGDLCMGTGLVGWYAHLNGRRFVGTELNKKRLALLVDRIMNHIK